MIAEKDMDLIIENLYEKAKNRKGRLTVALMLNSRSLSCHNIRWVPRFIPGGIMTSGLPGIISKNG